MLINTFDFQTIANLYKQGKTLKVNHFKLGDGVVHKLEESREIIFMVLDGDIYAFGPEENPEQQIHRLNDDDMAIFVV